MNQPEKTPDHDAARDIKDRPSRARYDKVKSGLDLKWRRRAPQPERMMREVVDALWDAFGGSPWTWCGMWALQPDGKAFQPGPARPEPKGAAVPNEGILKECFAAGEPKLDGGRIAVAVLDKNGRPWFVFEASSSAPFDEMDARWIERMFKAFQTIEKPDHNPS